MIALRALYVFVGLLLIWQAVIWVFDPPHFMLPAPLAVFEALRERPELWRVHAVTTLTEETHDPARTLPRAILLIALVGGAIFVVASYVTQLAHPGGAFADVGSAAYGIAGTIGGGTFQALFTAGQPRSVMFVSGYFPNGIMPTPMTETPFIASPS